MDTTSTKQKTGSFLKCNLCNDAYYCEPYRLKSSKFCSRLCGNRFIANRNIGKKFSKGTRDKISMALSMPKVGIVCVGCQKSFEVRHQHSFRKYCTKQCSLDNKPTWNKGKRMSPELRAKLSGKNASNWQGGKTTESQIIRHRVEYRLWREAVFARDNWTCQTCFTRGGTLNADHIKPFSLYPELRFAIDNGRTLCLECHKKTDTFGCKINNIKK